MPVSIGANAQTIILLNPLKALTLPITGFPDSSMAEQKVATSDFNAGAAKHSLGSSDDELLASFGYKQGHLYSSR